MLVAVVVAGCGASAGDDGDPASSDGAPSARVERSPATVAEVKEAVSRFAPEDPASWRELGLLTMQAPRSVVSELADEVSAGDVDVRIGATYVVSLRSEPGDSVLGEALDDPDERVRVLAAGASVGLGGHEAIPVLIEALDSTVALPPNPVPVTLGSLAREGLVAYTGQDFVTEQEWRDWWERAGPTVRWDGNVYVAS